jgi:primary-amine oxidase
MTYLLEKADKQQKSIEFVHPLEPLSAEEIKAAVATVKGVKQAQSLSDRTRFMSVALQEPPKDCVLAYNPGDSIDRQAFMVLLDNETGKTYEVIVSITQRSIVSWKYIPDVQPGFVLDEFFDCEAAVKASPEFQAALLKRGITDLDLVMVDPWSAGNYGLEDEEGVRLSRALSWVRSSPTDNGYARPIEGVIAVVDLNTMAVVRIDDYGDDSGNDSGVVPLSLLKTIATISSRWRLSNPKVPAFKSMGTRFVGRSGKCALALRPVKVWCFIQCLTKMRAKRDLFCTAPLWLR